VRRDSAVGLAAAAVVTSPVILGIAYATLAAFGMAGVGATGFTMARVSHVFADAETWRSLWWSTRTAVFATLIASAAAVAVGVAFRAGGRADRAAQLFAVLPLPIPHIVAAAAGILLLSQSGLLARFGYVVGIIHAPAQMPVLVGDPRGLGFTLTLAWKEFPFLSLVTFSLLATRGIAIEEAARTLGAGPWETLRRATLPMLWRGLLPAMIVVFIVIAGSYEAGALLSGSNPLPLPVLTYERYLDLDLARRGDAYVLTLLALSLGLVAVAAHEWARAWSERG